MISSLLLKNPIGSFASTRLVLADSDWIYFLFRLQSFLSRDLDRLTSEFLNFGKPTIFR